MKRSFYFIIIVNCLFLGIMMRFCTRDYDEEEMRYERRDREKERRLRNLERENKRCAIEKIPIKYENNVKEKKIIDMSYEDYIQDFILDPKYVKYLHENVKKE